MTVNSEGSRSSVSSSIPRASLSHLDAVADAFAAEAVGVDRLVRERQHVEQRNQMAHRSVDIDRLHGIAAPHMNRV